MILLVSGATKIVSKYAGSGFLGRLLCPRDGNRVPGSSLPWACDNSAFTHFDAASFCRFLGRVSGKPGCLWVTCPDVVGDARKTLEGFAVWHPILTQLGLPAAYVGQDGAEELDMPWGRISCLFIGGSTSWKLSRAAADLAGEAKRRGKIVHLGRCNSLRRFEFAYRLGCNSVDGSGFSRWPSRILLGIEWLSRLHAGAADSPDASLDLTKHLAEV